MSGDLKNGRTVHSLAKLLNLFDNLTFNFVSPKSLAMPTNIIDLLAKKHTINIFNKPDIAIQNADVIYCTRIQQERLSLDELTDKSSLYNIDKALISKNAKLDAIIMHPLPRDNRSNSFDLSTDLDDDSRLKIFTQAANGIPVRMALFIHCLGLSAEVGKDFIESKWAKTKL